ncbi:molybdopterin-dependent oxidoreductase [Polaromonas sp. A23]|uniref:molybdopterin-dependent oxidoreductase n=1 Tax=Polaromonas sp. A23 TaxID=1944133 RepID=UPI0009879DD7|nr:molybdopterin-dependent oxidoreductase [Polaromonas sp. A23]OOG35963.1 molybdopterin-dependent oxidoreductase [Polaromonas sp. A23]
MDRRALMGVAAWGAVALPELAQAVPASKALRGPILLTVSGQIGAGNRGAFDPAFDQMMGKQKISFDRAQVFDFVALTALPAVTIEPTLEYDAKPHRLKGPLLMDVMKASGVKVTSKTTLFLRAVDGYAAQVSASDVAKYRFIVATHLDGRPMALGGLGPLWAVYDADRFADMAAKPLPARFAWCPWATYHIEVKEG